MSRLTEFDVIVLGVGAMGSAALYHLARRGVSVCGVERHKIGHDFGSSHGHVRVIRQAYFEHPDYVPLLRRAYRLWESLEEQCSETLFVKSGMAVFGGPDSEAIAGLDACYAEHDLPHERMPAPALCERFPQFHIPRGHVGYWDPIAGYLYVEKCVEQHARLAVENGAEMLTATEVVDWRADTKGVTVVTNDGELFAHHLVLAAGAWSGPALASAGVKLNVTRQIQFWYDSPSLAQFEAPRFPIFFVENERGPFYGFPSIDGMGLKVAQHSDGPPVANPSSLTRDLQPGDEGPVRQFLSETFPDLKPDLLRHAPCMYSNTPDKHFVIDSHPEFSNVSIAAGFSGHGFKFASVVGEILADLAMTGRTEHPIGFLGFGRFRQ